MPQPRISRNLIHVISRFSNWNTKEVNESLHRYVYADNKGWTNFLRILLPTLGFGLLTAGVFFFFAYNWDDMKPWQKFGLIQILVIAACSVVFLKRPTQLVKHILLCIA